MHNKQQTDNLASRPLPHASFYTVKVFVLLYMLAMLFTACQKQQTALHANNVQTTTAAIKYGTTAVPLTQATTLAQHFLQTKKPGT